MNTSIGEYIRKYRTKRGLSQLQLAMEADYHQSHISALESGSRQAVSLGTLKRICKVLEIDYEQLAVFQGSLEGKIRDRTVIDAQKALDRDLT